MEGLLAGSNLAVSRCVLRGVGAWLRPYCSVTRDVEYFGKSPPNKLLLSRFVVMSDCQRSLDTGNLSNFTYRLKLLATPRIFEHPKARVKLANETFNKLLQSNKNTPNTLSFNVLLQIYRYNNHTFSPSYFLDFMTDNKCEPDLETFNLLFGAYCDEGKMSEANKLLEFMKSSNIPMSQDIYASMVTGYSRSGDLEAAKKVLETMKSEEVKVEQLVYTKLLCAYAERGQIDTIAKEYKIMEQALSNSTSHLMLIEVMDTLSRFGHGNKVEDMLSFYSLHYPVASVSMELHYLAISCLCRRELEAPLIIIGCLSKMNSLHDLLFSSYIGEAYHANHSVQDIHQSLLEKMECPLLQKFPEMMLTEIMNHQFARVQEVQSTGFPSKGILEQYAPGVKWVSDMRTALELIKKLDLFLRPIYYFPLFARHCSDANIEEMITTFDMMAKHGIKFGKLVQQYVQKTFSNSGVTMEEWIQQQIEQEADDEWLAKVLVFLLAHVEFKSAIAILEKSKRKEKLICDLTAVDPGILSEKLIKETEICANSVATLSKFGVPQQIFSKLWFVQDVLNQALIDGLECDELTNHIISEHVSKLLSGEQMELADTNYVWQLIQRTEYHLTPEELEAIFIMLSSKGTSKLKDTLSEIYDQLPQDKKDSFQIRCYHLALLGSKNDSSCLEKFAKLIEMGEPREIPYVVWRRMVNVAYRSHSDMADDLMVKMTEAGYAPSRSMLVALFKMFVSQKKVTNAEKILDKLMKINGEGSIYYYTLLLPQWAEHGDLEKIQELLDLILDFTTLKRTLPKGLLNSVLQARIAAHIENNNIEKALRLTRNQIKFTRAYLQIVIQLLMCKEQSLEQWREPLKSCGVSSELFDTIIFFTYMDYGLHTKAREYLKCISEFDLVMFKSSMANAGRKKYVDIFEEWGAPVNSKLLAITEANEETEEQDEVECLHSETEETEKISLSQTNSLSS